MNNQIGFIGLGTMGKPMARCLLANEYLLLGWDNQISAVTDFDSVAATLSQLAVECTTFITMLPEAVHVNEVVDQLLEAGVSDHCLFIDCSTIDVASTRELAHRLTNLGHGFIDAPVSGGHEAALAGNLSFMVGGEASDIERAKPLLETMGSKLVEFGVAGNGQAAKACHNMICGITALAVCESFSLADALGLDLESFFQLCQGAAAQSWILENRCPVPGPAPAAPASNGYAPGFAARLMAKDLGLAQMAAKSSGQPTEFGAAAARRFRQFVETDNGDLDFSAIYQSIHR